MQSAYEKAFLLAPPVVLKRQLLPFSLGHSYLLECFESPYVIGDGDITDGSLVLAVWICSRTFEDACTAIRNGDVDKTVGRWAKKCRRAKWADEHETFIAYSLASRDMPKRWEDETDSPVRVPWQFLLVWNLCGGHIHPDAESNAWNMPYSRAMAYNAARGFIAGDDAYMKEEDITLMEGTADAAS